MKKIFFAVIPCLFTALSFNAGAQDDQKLKDEKKEKESQEIIIRKKGDKDVNLTIQISGDKVTVNGKPLVEFKDDAITVNKRKVMVRDGERTWFGEGMGEGGNLGSFSWSDDEDEKTAFLGVTTEKVKEGAKINEINEESAAAKAGLKEDDIITKVGDTKIDGPESLSKAIKAKKPKDEVKIFYLRDGKEKTVQAALQERKANRRMYSFSGPDGSYKTLTIPAVPQIKDYNELYGEDMAPHPFIYNGDNFDFDKSPFRRKKLGLKIQDTEEGNGVKVLEVEDSSAAANAGVKKDDIVTEIGGVKVKNTDEVREQFQEMQEKSAYNIKALRNGKEMSFEIKIPKKLKTANF